MAASRRVATATGIGAGTETGIETETEHGLSEQTALLSDEENRVRRTRERRPRNRYASLPVFSTIHRIRREVIESLEDPYSLEQLRAPRINASVVRPLANRLADLDDVSVVYCLLVNKLQFLREQTFQAHQTITTTRAQLCELLALKILRRFDEENPGHDGLLLLSNIMVAGFEPFQNAPPDVLRDKQRNMPWRSGQNRGGYEGKTNMLEMAIISESKMLLCSPPCQKVMDAIYVGRIIYTPSSFIDILPDYYKHKPIEVYHPEQAPWLNQYRLMVPRTRNLLDMGQFFVLLVLYVVTMQKRHGVVFTVYELAFCIYALGWVLDELASILEHGWQCYTQNLWSFLDLIFAVIFSIYFIVRMNHLGTGDDIIGRLALNILAAGAPVLIPRLAFNIMSENMLFVCLRAMMSDFTVLTLLAAWCFAGFLFSMVWLGERKFLTITIAKWMLYVWFGLDGTGVQKSVEFHWFIGPVIMVAFAFLGNTLFLTILVSMLTSTYAKIASNAQSEIQFRRAVLTFEGVKSDAIFSYQPPFNMLALATLLPLKLMVSPRWFHKVNVTAIRIINAPLLLSISFYERRNLWKDDVSRKASMLRFWDFSRFSVHADTQAVFEYDPPEQAASNGATSPPVPGRKESFRALPAITDLKEHGQDVLQRLEAMEASNGRIEELLRRMNRDVDELDESDF